MRRVVAGAGMLGGMSVRVVTERLKRVVLDHALARVGISVLAVFVGWVAGVYVYFGLLIVTGNPPESGDIHVGILPLGLIGMVIAVRSTRRWIRRTRVAANVRDAIAGRHDAHRPI